MKQTNFSVHPSQRDIFVDQLINEGSPKYNIGGYIKLIGILDIEILEQAANLASKDFDAFKMRFDFGNLDYQGIVDEEFTGIEITKLDFSESVNPITEANLWMQKRFNTVFEFGIEKLLFEHVLIKISETEHWFFHKYHHLITDGYGFAVWVKHFSETYKSLKLGVYTSSKFASYVEESNNALVYLGSKDYQEDSSYWQSKFKEKPSHLLEQRRLLKTDEVLGGTHIYVPDLEEKNSLDRIVESTGYGLQPLTIAVLLVYFGKISNLSTIALGVPVHKRSSKKLKNIVGMFSSILPFTGTYDSQKTFLELLSEVSAALKSDYRHQNYPMGDLSRDLKLNPQQDSLTDVVVNYESLNFVPDFGSDIKASIIRLGSEFEDRPLEICWRDYGDQQPLELVFLYLKTYFSEEEIKSFSNSLMFMLKQIPELLNKPVNQFKIILDSEWTLLKSFNQTNQPFSKDQTIVELFEQQVKSTPNQTALVYEGQTLSYQELNERANQLAYYLRAKGVKPETRLAICLDRGFEMLVGILGILKSGGAYVPIDPQYPAERVQYMLEDCSATIVVSTSAQSALFQEHQAIKQTELDQLDLSKYPKTNPDKTVTQDNLAYVIYTSGSTGKPKGVMIEHGNVYSFIDWCKREFNAQSFEMVYAGTSMCFDLSVYEFFYPLSIGKTIRILENGLEISKYIKTDQQVLTNSVPSVIESLLKQQTDFSNAKVINMAGEPISDYVQQTLDTQTIEVRNLYGPSEDTTYSTVYRLSPQTSLKIGKPIANTKVFILSPTQDLLPIGVKGEIYLGGAGLARGYLNNEALTQEKFIPNPFDKTERLYRTGDIGRWLKDGNIEYLGRVDDQVKIRGFRIEPGEIESAIAESKLVSQSVVIAQADQTGSNRLIVYVVVGKTYQKQELLAYLRSKLPDYMIPSVIMELENIPLTANGKVDKRALPHVDQSSDKQYIAPRNKTEKALAEIWQQLLEIENVGIDANFFELGGHSLLAMRVISQVGKTLDIELKVKDLFQNPSIRQLAFYVSKQSQGLLLPAIDKQIRPEQIPLSFSQERLWFIDQLEGSVQYHIPAVLHLKGKLNQKALNQSFQQIVSRHEVLRTVIRQAQGQPYQQINPVAETIVQTIDAKALTPQERQTLIKSLINKPFDLSQDLMLRADLLELGEEDHLLVVTMHHIASDGWSGPLIVKELTSFYQAYNQDQIPQSEPLAIQYADYAIWQRQNIQGQLLEKKLEYWKQKLQQAEPIELPLDYPRPAVQSIQGAVKTFTLDASLGKAIKQLSQNSNTSMFMTLLSAFKVLLHRYSNQHDITVGTPIAGRQQMETEPLIGFFVNTLALRSELKADQSFQELLDQVRTTTLEAYEHQEIPFEKVVETVVKQRDLSRSPLFQVMFVYQNTPEMPKLELGELDLSMDTSVAASSKFEISLTMHESNEGLEGSLEYCTDLYSESTIERMQSHFVALLKSITTDPKTQIGELEMLRSEEQTQLLETFNQTKKSYPQDQTIIELFEQQVKRSPQATAIIFEDQILSYQELNEKSNQLAHYLKAKGVKPETLVPICLERSVEMMIGILGILKSGGAYVPIDPQYPQDRMAYMLNDCKSHFVISREALLAGSLNDPSLEIIDVNKEEIQKCASENLDHKVKAENLAYIIYTSGSTGNPKGVMIEHRSLVNVVKCQSDFFQIEDKDRVLQFFNYCFDASVLQIFMTLLNGAALVLFKEGLQLRKEEFEQFVVDQNITRLQTTPGFLENLTLDAPTSLKSVIVGGDICKSNLSNYWQKRFDFFIEYGPTETTVAAISYKSPKGSADAIKPLPIGKGLANLEIYILNENQKLQPLGVAGEICIGGVQVARGYLNNKELTSLNFIPNPFKEDAEELIYKTGDFARWLPDGNIEYIGRRDSQVKIRGFRIELGEIEMALQQQAEISQAIVLAKADKQGNNRLIAYVVAQSKFDKELAIANLKKTLPEYMVPMFWVELETLPFTSNNKIDKAALPLPEDLFENSHAYIAPRDEDETRLAEIWQQTLGIEKIGIHDNFFELGGHSLLAMRLISKIRNQFSINLEVRDLFLHPTIAQLGPYLKNIKVSVLLPPIEKAESVSRVPLSFGQERFWFIDQLEGTVQYHSPQVLRLKGELNNEALDFALHQIIERHQILRTVIKTDELGERQVLKPVEDWNLNFVNGLIYQNDEEALYKYVKYLVDEPFDLANDFVIRAHLISLGKNDHLLVVVIHHIASDAWSSVLIIKEFNEFYNAYDEKRKPEIELLKLQYADFAIWQRNYLQGELLQNKLNYWKHKLSDLVPLQLPTDFLRPAVQRMRGAMIQGSLNQDITYKLNSLCKENNASMFMVLLSAFKVLLYRYSGQEDICIGIPVADRQQTEIENLVGYFVNSLSLRTEVKGDDTFKTLLERVKLGTLDALEHQDVPFEKVVEAVVKERDLSRSPLFQVMFALQNTPDIPELNFGELKVQVEKFEQSSAQFDFTFQVAQKPDGLKIYVEYSTDLYTESTIKRLIEHYEELLVSIVANSDQYLGKLNLLSKSEEMLLLKGFNNTSGYFPTKKTIVNLFEEQVERTPDKVALIYGNEAFTYNEINERSNQLAHYLKSKGVKPESLVPICLDRSIEMVVAMLGVLKSGGAYVPIDPEYPIDRIGYMLYDTGAEIVISTSLNRSKIKEEEYAIIELDVDWPIISLSSAKNLATVSASGHLSYLIYTSGSTGTPKGVMVEHKALVNLINWHIQTYDVTELSKSTSMAGVGFDAFGWEIWPYLSAGASIQIINDSVRVSPTELVDLFIDKCITHSFISTALVSEIINATRNKRTSLKYILTGGDKLLSTDVKELDYRLVNNYGPTEYTVVTTNYEISEKDRFQVPLIGKPIANTSIYILSKDGELSPIGVSGEIHITGVQLARGYLNLAQLTAEKFISKSFNGFVSERMYKTGDMGRWLKDGNIEYLGRKDDQVNIRGYRIELGEIESVLKDCELVKRAVVLAREEKEGNKHLVGYVVPKGPLDIDGILAFLRSKLPEYMVPVTWVELQTMPITLNGKLDKKALPDPYAREGVQKEHVSPRNETENKLAAIWEELIGINKISIHDNFFELGGDSILTIQLVSRARREGLEFQVLDIFSTQTIAKLASLIDHRKNAASEVLGEQGMLNGESGLLPIQQWYFAKRHKNISHYNQSVLLRINKKVVEDDLIKMLESISMFHDALRFKYFQLDGKWHQEYGNSTIVLQTEDLHLSSTNALMEAVTKITNEQQRTVSVEHGDLVKVILFKMPENYEENLLFFAIHHLAVDGVSWRILVEDMEMILSGLKRNKTLDLGFKTSSYRQWFEALKVYGQTEALLSQKRYWQTIIKRYEPLKTDKNFDGIIGIKDIDIFNISLSVDQTRQLIQEAPITYHTEINDLLICALGLTLAEFADSNSIVIGMEGHGRENISQQIDTSRTIGWFTSVFPVLLEVDVQASLSDSIKQVKENLRKIPTKGIGYGVLKYINKEEVFQGSESWDIVFNYLGQVDNAIQNNLWFKGRENIESKDIDEFYEVSEKLSINSYVQDGELVFNWSYSSLQYKPETIKKLASTYIKNILSISEHCIEAQQKSGGKHTPSDFDLGSDISYDELDRFLEEDNEDDILTF
jgi:amino acid adenylation domain-containing protein/non-ribosomal peptide synthase protein (TIGR01720 family)